MYIELDICPTKIAGVFVKRLDKETLATLLDKVSLSQRQKLVTSSSGSLSLVLLSSVVRPSSFLTSSRETCSMLTNFFPL